MKKVLGLTAIEAPFRSRLVETQFFGPLAQASQGGAWRLSFLSLVPATFFLGRPGVWGRLSGHLSRIRRTKSDLSLAGIVWRLQVTLYPLFPVQFNLRPLEAALFLAVSLPGLWLKLWATRPDLVIARSYPAALLAWLARRALGIPYLFDLRGMYPEESVNAGRFELGSAGYHFWKGWERRLISSAARCVVVSQPFAEQLASIDQGAKVSVIPCCVDQGSIRTGDKQALKAKYGLSGRFVLLHLGSFGTPGDRGLAGRYLKRFQTIRPDAVLVVASATPAFGPAIRDALQAEGLASGDYRVFHPSSAEVAEMLSLGDAGLILERKMPNTKVCLSVKLGEYLAAGLPVICTPHVEGVARLVDRYQCGLIVDPDCDPPLDGERDFLNLYREFQENGFRLVSQQLSLERCSARWREIIEQELSG